MSHSSSSSKSKKESGDKNFVGGSPADRKVFIADIIQCIQTKAPKTLLITIADLSAHLHQQDALSSSNLFRKQYGNLEHVFNVEHMPAIFNVENSVIRLQPMEILQIALTKKHLAEELFQKCSDMHTFKLIHDLSTYKSIGKNVCKACKQTYSVIANNGNTCGNKSHEPAYNFEANEDVLKCAI